MIAGFFYRVFEEFKNDTAIIYKNQHVSYVSLMTKITYYGAKLSLNNIRQGDVVALFGDFTPDTIAILFALIENRNIIVPFTNLFQSDIHHEESRKEVISGVKKAIVVNTRFDHVVFALDYDSDFSHPFYEKLRKENHPGLVLFTSGSTGEPKAAVHDFVNLLEKFKTRKRTLRTLNFLLFDHWGGLNTMFHTLSNGGTVIAIKDHRPDAVCQAIEKYKIELLPVSPTFLNLLLISEAYKRYDLSSLLVITYGTEPMPLSTLNRIKDEFLNVKLQQTYGLIELGVMRSKSKSDDSLWMKIGGDGFETRIVDGLLEIKAESAMLGYLNAPSPFTEDGWFQTGDQVEADGEYIKILGRKSEIINVGGLKVYPAEVENIIQQMDNVAEVTVYGEKNAIMGNIVCAKVRLVKEEDLYFFTGKLKAECHLHLLPYMVPIKVIFSDEEQHNERFKKRRV